MDWNKATISSWHKSPTLASPIFKMMSPGLRADAAAGVSAGTSITVSIAGLPRRDGQTNRSH